MVILVYAILFGLALGIIISVARLATELPKYTAQTDDLVNSLTARLGVGPDELRQAASSLNLSKLAAVLGVLLASVAGLASNFVFLLSLLLFLSIDAGGAGDRLAAIAVERPRIVEALGHFAWGTRQYLLVTTVFGLIVAVLDWVALSIMGIPLALTWGLLAFITNYIPNVGFIIGVVPPALLGLLTGGPKLLVIVIVVYRVLNFIVQSVIQPRFIGDAVGLSITVTFIALVFLGVVAGSARGHPGHSAHLVGKGCAGGCGPAGPLGRRAAAGVGQGTGPDCVQATASSTLRPRLARRHNDRFDMTLAVARARIARLG